MSQNYVPPEVSSLLGLIDTHLRWKKQQEKHDREYFYYHPSEWGKCLRKQQYKHFVQLGYIESPPAEQIGGQKARLFDKGHNMHSRWQNWYFAEMGILRGRWKCLNPLCFTFDNEGKDRRDNLKEEHWKHINEGQTRVFGVKEKLGCFRPEKCNCGHNKFTYCEVPVVSDELKLKGNADIILDFSNFDPGKYKGVRKTFNELVFPKKPIVVDMKTINDWSWKQQLLKVGAHKEYIVQVTIYAHLLDCEYGILIYENKNDSTAMAYKVERNNDLFGIVREQAKRMIVLSESKKLPPPKPEDQSVRECQDCEFSSMCHKSKIWEDDKLDEKRRMFYKSLL